MDHVVGVGVRGRAGCEGVSLGQLDDEQAEVEGEPVDPDEEDAVGDVDATATMLLVTHVGCDALSQRSQCSNGVCRRFCRKERHSTMSRRV